MSVLCVIDTDGRTGRWELMTALMSDSGIKGKRGVKSYPG